MIFRNFPAVISLYELLKLYINPHRSSENWFSMSEKDYEYYFMYF